MKRIPFLIFLIISLLVFPNTKSTAADLGKMKQVTAVRWYDHISDASAPAQLRMVLDQTGPVTYNTFVLTNPSRLVVDLNGAWINASMPRSLSVDNEMVHKVRVNQNQPNVVRVVLDIKEGMRADDFRIFSLPEDVSNGKPYRLVLDFGRLQSLSEVSAGAGSKPGPVAPTSPFPNPKPIKFFEQPGLANKVIVLDPGHGGSDCGAVGPGRTQEKNVTLAISQEVKKLLEKSGTTVLMTRTGDNDVYGPEATAAQELQARADVGNTAAADLFVSIHINAFNQANVNGTSTYYYPKTTGDVRLASFLQDGMVGQMNLLDRGKIPARFYVLKHTDMPAALVEVAFISNPNEEKLLNNPKFLKKVAQGIYDGLARYFTPGE
jgi:N-acetylmuramoyl-L-alanine amidase